MSDLVKLAIEAHGGLDRWSKVQQISSAFSASGAGFKQRGPVAEEITRLQMRATVVTGEQKTVFEPFAAPAQRGVYVPNRTVVESLDGKSIEVLDNPRDVLKNIVPGTPWSVTQVLYFLGYSLWMYFTLPYSFLADGVACEEIEPWSEHGETWRALKVTFPASYPSHSTEQIHYFDAAGIMRRQDYTVDVRHNLNAAHYLEGHREFGGFVFPTRRRIYSRGADGAPIMDRLLISADLDDYQITRANR